DHPHERALVRRRFGLGRHVRRRGGSRFGRCRVGHGRLPGKGSRGAFAWNISRSRALGHPSTTSFDEAPVSAPRSEAGGPDGSGPFGPYARSAASCASTAPWTLPWIRSGPRRSRTPSFARTP